MGGEVLKDVLAGFLMVFILIYGVILLVAIVMSVLHIIATWKLYEKAGEPGWSAIIPVYNYMQMIKIATGKMTLAWIYLALTGGYMLFTVIGSVIEAFMANNPDFEMFKILIMCSSFLWMIPLYVIAGYTSYMFAKSYGKSQTFCILSIFFSGITILIMGFDNRTFYVGPKGVPQNNYYGGYTQNY